MENIDDETTYQYYTITNDDEIETLGSEENNIISIPSQFDINNKQILYLTLNNQNDTKNDFIPDDNVLEDTSSEAFPNNTDMKLITLEDGRMFMTGAGTSLNALQSMIKPQVPEEQQSESDEEKPQIQEEQETETLDINNEITYQLVQLPDGTQALIKFFNPQQKEAPSEEPPSRKKFYCHFEDCEKFYNTSYHLSVHMRNHTDCKPYACPSDDCDKRFSTNYSLKAHIRTHTGEKPYGCTQCAKHFKTSGDLQKHIRIHTGEKPFQCPIDGCGRSFTTSNIRKVHIRSHTGERPYACTYTDCGKSFTSSTNYKNHLRIHSGEKPYLCPVENCGKRFTEYSSLYKHNSVHTALRPYICSFCEQQFKAEPALNLHKRLKHNVMIKKDGTEIVVKIE